MAGTSREKVLNSIRGNGGPECPVIPGLLRNKPFPHRKVGETTTPVKTSLLGVLHEKAKNLD